MPFDLSHVDAPERLATHAFVLRPLTPADNPLDHDALMESRHDLRLWDQSTWPEDEFSLADNLRDMELVEQWRNDDKAFVYTVLTPDESRCLGCVYLFPPNAPFLERSTVSAVGVPQWSDVAVAMYFWVRSSLAADGLDRTLLDAARRWLTDEWPLAGSRVVVTSTPFEQQVATIEAAGLELQFEIVSDDADLPFLAYGEPTGGA